MKWDLNKQPLKTDQSNRTTVYVWLPKVNGQIATLSECIQASTRTPNININIGHAAVTLSNGRHVSWWPEKRMTKTAEYFFTRKCRAQSLEEDIHLEGGEPDLVVSLYSLQTSEMDALLDDIGIDQDNPDLGYVLLGDKVTTRLLNRRRGQSCCGLAYEVLIHGGSYRYHQWFTDMETRYVMVTPENFRDYVKHIKEQEVNSYPETLNFNRTNRHINEYLPDPAPTPAANPKCIVM